MASLMIIIIIIFTFFSSSLQTSDSFVVVDGLLTRRSKPEKLSHFHFFFQDTLSGKHPSAVPIVRPPKGLFGRTVMTDDALTAARGPNSKAVGRAQGLYAFAAQRELAVLMVMNLVFTDGKYNGNSLSVLGRNPVTRAVREMPIVGGSGLFRFARGYALAHTVWFDAKTGDAVVEYNVYVLHY